MEVLEVVGLVVDALGADFLGGVELEWAGRAGEDDDFEVAQGWFLLAYPLDEVEAGFGFHADVGEHDFGHGIEVAVRVHASAQKVGLGFAGVSADGRDAAIGGVEGAFDEEGVVGVVFDDQEFIFFNRRVHEPFIRPEARRVCNAVTHRGWDEILVGGNHDWFWVGAGKDGTAQIWEVIFL